MAVNAYSFFVRCMVLSWFNRREEKMAVSDLFHKFTYRYTAAERGSWLSPVRYFKKAAATVWRSNPIMIKATAAGLVYESDRSFEETDRHYFSGIIKEVPAFIFRSDLPNTLTFFQKCFCLCQLTLLFLCVLPGALLARDKAGRSLILLELTETLLLFHAVKKCSCKDIYILSAFERDIVFVSYFLKRNGRRTLLVPSSNPVSFFYKNVVCDTFIFTAPFQTYEYEKLKQNWIVENTSLWPPFEYYSIERNISGSEPQTPVIGFMSSASALREHLKHNNHSQNKDFDAEKALIDHLAVFLKENRQYTLLIYLHPLEKANENNLDFSRNYYRTIFGEAVQFAPLQPSRSCFGLCDVAVSGFSSAQIERLYGGYKVVFAPMGFFENYFSDPRLDAISIHNTHEFASKLESVLKMDTSSFFETFDLKQYRWDFYKL